MTLAEFILIAVTMTIQLLTIIILARDIRSMKKTK